jgi:hypothetical protein
MTTTTMEKKGIKPARYQIKIEGKIRKDWSDWLNGMEISTRKGCQGSQITILVGEVTDQAALRGILCRLWDLNLTIVSVDRLEMNAGEEERKNE